MFSGSVSVNKIVVVKSFYRNGMSCSRRVGCAMVRDKEANSMSSALLPGGDTRLVLPSLFCSCHLHGAGQVTFSESQFCHLPTGVLGTT